MEKNNRVYLKELNNKHRLLRHFKLLFEVQYITFGPTAFQPPYTLTLFVDLYFA